MLSKKEKKSHLSKENNVVYIATKYSGENFSLCKAILDAVLMASWFLCYCEASGGRGAVLVTFVETVATRHGASGTADPGSRPRPTREKEEKRAACPFSQWMRHA